MNECESLTKGGHLLYNINQVSKVKHPATPELLAISLLLTDLPGNQERGRIDAFSWFAPGPLSDLLFLSWLSLSGHRL